MSRFRHSPDFGHSAPYCKVFAFKCLVAIIYLSGAPQNFKWLGNTARTFIRNIGKGEEGVLKSLKHFLGKNLILLNIGRKIMANVNGSFIKIARK